LSWSYLLYFAFSYDDSRRRVYHLKLGKLSSPGLLGHSSCSLGGVGPNRRELRLLAIFETEFHRMSLGFRFWMFSALPVSIFQ